MNRQLNHTSWRLLGQAVLCMTLNLSEAKAQTGTNEWQLSMRSERHSDALSLNQLDAEDWAKQLSPRPGRNLTYASDEIRLSRQKDGLTLTLLARSSATLIASENALSLAALLARREMPERDMSWQNEVLFQGFSGVGIEASLDKVLSPRWKARWSVQGLMLRQLRERKLNGSVQYMSASDAYLLNLSSHDINNDLLFPFQKKSDSHGLGLLFGGELGWAGEQLFSSVSLHDVGVLHWSGLPMQTTFLNTARASTDADGFLIYNSLIQGKNSQNTASKNAPWRTSFDLGWRFTETQRVDMRFDYIPYFGILPVLGWRQRNGQVNWGLDWHMHERRVGVSAAWQGWQIQAGADRLSSQSRSRELSVSYFLPF